MRRLTFGAIGFMLGLVIVSALISAAALAAIGVGAHLLAERDSGAASVISIDPSSVAAMAPIPAAIAAGLIVVFAITVFVLGRMERSVRRKT